MHFVEEITNLKKTYKKFSGSKTASFALFAIFYAPCCLNFERYGPNASFPSQN